MKNKPGVQGDDRPTYSVLSLSMPVPISTHIALLTASTSSVIALFQLPLLFPWINSLRVSTCLAPSPRCRSRCSFPSPLPCTLVPFSWTKFCLAAKYIAHFPTTYSPYTFGIFYLRPVSFAAFLSSLVSPHSSFGLLFASLQFLLLLFCLLQSRPILLA